MGAWELRRTFTQRGNRLLNLIGLAIVRVPRPSGTPPASMATKADKTSWIIELVGPSGIGKSTFLQYLMDTSSELDDYLCLTGSIRLTTANRARRKNHDPMWTRLLDELALRESADSGNPSRIERERRELRRRVLQQETALRFEMDFDRIVVDHSLVYFFRTYFRNLHVSDRALFWFAMSNRAVVVCHVTPDVNVERIRSRSIRERTQPFHVGCTDEELMQRTTRGEQRWLEYGDWLEAVGVPVLRLDLGRLPEESKSLLSKFIRDLN